jgi:hypothetical protein
MLGGFPVTTAWRVLGLRMEERPPAMEVAAYIWNKQPRTNDRGRSSSLGIWRGVTTLPHKINLLRKSLKSLGPGRILWINDPSDEIRKLEYTRL